MTTSPVPKPNDQTNNPKEHNMVKNPNWQEADQLAIYRHDRVVGLAEGPTEKQLQLSAQSGNPRHPDFKSGALTSRPRCLPRGLQAMSS